MVNRPRLSLIWQTGEAKNQTGYPWFTSGVVHPLHHCCSKILRWAIQLNKLLMLLLTLNAPIATKVVCFSGLLKCLRSLYGKQCGPRSDCSYRSSLFWVHPVCFYTGFVSNARQLFAADDFCRHFQMHFFLGTLRVKENIWADNGLILKL